jgi:pimeloyl-ACP methyl ester carboxylesterase
VGLGHRGDDAHPAAAVTAAEPADLPSVAGVRHRRVDVGGISLHVAEAGSGPPLLLLHGWPQHWWCWRRVLPELATTYRVLAPDLRGWGWSAAPPGDYAKSTLAKDVLALMDAEGIERARIIGHDWGAYVGFLLALDHPERVEQLVALDIAPPWPGRLRPRRLVVPMLGSYQALLAAPLVGERALTSGVGLVRTLIRLGSGPGASWTDRELNAYADVLRQPARARASSACYRTFLGRELPAVLRGPNRSASLAVESLLILGGASPMHWALDPEPSRNLRVETIPRAGHFLPEEAPDEVLALAQPFLSAPSAAGRAP